MIEFDYTQLPIKLTSLEDILKAIQNETINYGINKDYCFVTDEDGALVFLKRIYGIEAYLDKEHNISEERWPINQWDGECIWSVETTTNRGLEITEMFLRFLNIEYQG